MFVDVYIFLPFTVFLYMDAWENEHTCFLYIVHFDCSGGQRAGQPLQVSQFEWQQDEADTITDVHCALWVQYVMRRTTADIFLKPFSHRPVHPEEKKTRGVWGLCACACECVCVCLCGRCMYRNTKPWESMSAPCPECRKLPEFPTTAQLRQREGTGSKSIEGGDMTWNIFEITSSKDWSLLARWRLCGRADTIFFLFFPPSVASYI